MTLMLRLCVIWLIVVLGPLAWLAQSGINLNETIAPTTMTWDGGFAFVTPVDAPPLLKAKSDGGSAPTASSLRLLEDGTPSSRHQLSPIAHCIVSKSLIVLSGDVNPRKHPQ
jgi:hypothetical protein